MNETQHKDFSFLKEAIRQRASTFNHHLGTYLPDKEPKHLYDASRHLPLSGGKRLRPVITMLATEALTGTYEQSMPFAAALEIMHNFTLVHDDIMDNADLRRGSPTVHSEYGLPTALLAGDCLFAISFQATLRLKVPPTEFKTLQEQFITCIIDICEGQQEDMDFEERKIVSEEEYMQMIKKKTAVLFALASRSAGIITHSTKEQIGALDSYGYSLGLAFQIWDDYLDMSSTAETLGKDIGNDIRNGKKTLIAVHALRNAQAEDKEILDRIFGNRNATDEEIQQVHGVFDRTGSINYAKDTAIEYNEKAKEALRVLPQSEAKEILTLLADYAIQRTH